MLEPWIIEEIRRREQEERDRPFLPLELPLEAPPAPTIDEASPPPVNDRGIVIIEL